MQVTSQLKEQDYTTYARAVGKSHRGRTYTHVAACIALAVIAGLLAVSLKNILFKLLGSPGDAWDGGVYFLLFFFIFLSLMRGFARMFARGRFSPNGQFLAATQFTLQHDGFTTQTRYTQGSVDWRGVQRLAETKDLMLIYIDTMQAYIIPKRCFASPEAAAAFYQQAQNYWQATRQQPIAQPTPPAGAA
ncbi:MAG: YcxB family protein [Alphaproteobacteria bacterium]|nr:YcxB family protein [Alphaproteobacteria bacterium]